MHKFVVTVLRDVGRMRGGAWGGSIVTRAKDHAEAFWRATGLQLPVNEYFLGANTYRVMVIDGNEEEAIVTYVSPKHDQ